MLNAHKSPSGQKPHQKCPTSFDASQAALEAALNSKDLPERQAADYVIKCFFYRNPSGTLTVASSFAPGVPQPSIGGNLVRHMATCAEGSPVGRRAVRVLRHMLEEELEVKERLLQTAVQVPGDQHTQQDLLLNW